MYLIGSQILLLCLATSWTYLGSIPVSSRYCPVRFLPSPSVVNTDRLFLGVKRGGFHSPPSVLTAVSLAVIRLRVLVSASGCQLQFCKVLTELYCLWHETCLSVGSHRLLALIKNNIKMSLLCYPELQRHHLHEVQSPCCSQFTSCKLC
jgi:hypothetical protein